MIWSFSSDELYFRLAFSDIMIIDGPNENRNRKPERTMIGTLTEFYNKDLATIHQSSNWRYLVQVNLLQQDLA